jgi:hypothetical protein
VTYDPQAHRASTCAHLLKLAGTGPGWHAYTLRRAEDLQREDAALHAGLLSTIEAQLGPKATKDARRAAQWMEGRSA